MDWTANGVAHYDELAISECVGRLLPLNLTPPKDPFPYARHAASRPFTPGLDAGIYVYALDANGVVWVVPDGPHMHPQILGGGLPAAGAGEIAIEAGGVVIQVNNLSGTFQCGPDTLTDVVQALQRQGATIIEDSIQPFHWED